VLVVVVFVNSFLAPSVEYDMEIANLPLANLKLSFFGLSSITVPSFKFCCRDCSWIAQRAVSAIWRQTPHAQLSRSSPGSEILPDR